MTHRFKFPDEATFYSMYSTGPEIVVIGVITRTVMDGETVVSQTVTPGFHVDALGDVPDAWAAYEIFPASPKHVFFGVS